MRDRVLHDGTGYYMTVQGIMQQLQSSPHQQGSWTGLGFAIEDAVLETDPFVEAGIFASVVEDGLFEGI